MVDQKTRFILFFDGTANKPASETNIHRLYQATCHGWHKGARQVPRYWHGVGVHFGERLRGRMFGYRLQSIIEEAYKWLAAAHREGDEVYIFGFSRGAFTAMGLAGLLAWRGLPKEPYWAEERNKLNELKRHLDLYFTAAQLAREQKTDGVRPLTELMSDLTEPKRAALEGLDREVVEKFRLVPVDFVGVFDSVRAAGLEVTRWRFGNVPEEVSADEHPEQPGTLVYRYTRHLPPNVRLGFQALAVDEERAAFHPRVWIIPKKPEAMPAGRTVEQRWFVGAHANVGGGYKGDSLSLIPLHWMQTKADVAGIQFHKHIPTPPSAYKSDKTDSFEKFIGSWVSWKRYCRPMLGVLPSTEMQAAYVINQKTEKQTIDKTVFERLRDMPKYRPENVISCLKRLPTIDIISDSVDEHLIDQCKTLVRAAEWTKG